MRKTRCPICENKTYFKDRQSLISHISKRHNECIPQGWDASQYENYLRTGKTHGSCMVCKNDTNWNHTTNKYSRLCDNPECKKFLAQKAEENMIKKTGMTKSERMKQADVQTKMIYSKHTSGCYKVDDHEIWYDSSYGKEFIELLDVYLNLDMKDISGPSTNNYEYKYNGKSHMYIPDFRIHSLNLEVEIKDGGDNPNNHPKIQMVDKKKEEEKDKIMQKLEKQGKLHYIKIVNKDYRAFFELLMRLRNQYDGKNGTPSLTKDNVEYVDESIRDLEFIDLIKIGDEAIKVSQIDNVVVNKPASYRHIPVFYLKKVRQMTSEDVMFWEMKVNQTLAILVAKKKSDKSYELEEVIREMQTIVIPEMNRRIEYLKNKEAKKSGGKRNKH